MQKRELIKKTKQELMEIAGKMGLVGRSRMKKEELALSISGFLKKKAPAAVEKKAGQKVEKKPSAAGKVKFSVKRKEEVAALPAAAGKAEGWQEKVEDTKFYLGAEEKGVITEEELPESYGDNKVVLMVRDPHWAYVYWEINSRKVAEARSRLESDFDHSRLILRVYDITGIEFNGGNAHSFFDIEIPNVLGNWYVHIGRPNRTFCIDIGYRNQEGGIFSLSRSNKITSPRDSFSEVADEEWMASDEDYKRIYADTGIGAGSSLELVEAMQKRLERGISSAGVRGVVPKTSHNH
ncbi:MAG: DUF4912 domain-containing protein [Deltaproteobacteria bacterium]